MIELKAYRPYANRDGFYHKSDVDKVLADLEESHKRWREKKQELTANEQT